jgi:diaminohydroxyphosphoribosylaminopyrimidine deaminase/5-amino-6-(5-phosphoribosylamino)uracil reductase
VEALESRDLRKALARIASHEVLSLLVEGGPTLQAAFAEAGLVDRVQWVVTSRTLGEGVAAASVLSPEMLADGATTATALGHDLLMEFDVHRTDRSDRSYRPH